MLGLHWLDWLVLGGFFAGVLLVGKLTAGKVKTSQDLIQGGRSLGKWLSACLSFGSITDAQQAASLTREMYRQGLQGVWFSNLVLFHTPFQWFTALLQRRTRYSAPGDMYQYRFESKFLAGLFAVFLISSSFFGNAFGFLVTGKTLQAMMVKPESAYTTQERAKVDGFLRLRALNEKRAGAALTDEEMGELRTLEDMKKRGETASFISYLNLTWFYFIYAGIIILYTVIGGLMAVVFLDILQGVMIVFLSLALIPAGLKALGGFSGLHQSVPDHMFEVFGSGVASEYTWYFVGAFSLLNLVVNSPRNFTWGVSSKDDLSAQIGFVSGSLTKRIMMVGWALTGLVALGLYAGKVSDPDNIWGIMTRDLLGPGFIGLMIASIFLANMDGGAAGSIEVAAAFTKNLLLPLKPNLTDKKQLFISRCVIVCMMSGSVFFAHRVNDIRELFQTILMMLTVVGPAGWLMYFWRRLNTKAVATQMILSILLTVVLPNAIPWWPGVRTSPALTIQTAERSQVATVRAKIVDVEQKRAKAVGEMIELKQIMPASAVFFDKVVRLRPEDPQSPMVGQGAFKVHLYLLSLVGFDFEYWTKVEVATAGFLFNIIFPFAVMLAVGSVTKPNSESALRYFYACVHTPCVPDQAEDAKNVQRAVEDPSLVEKNKLFPGTNWEFSKWSRRDVLAFSGCWAAVLAIIGLYYVVASIGA